MPHMRGVIMHDFVRRVDHYVTIARAEQVHHIGLEHGVFDQMVYDIKREGQVSLEQASTIDKIRAVIEEEAFAQIVGEPVLAHLDCRSGHVEANITWIVSQ